MASEGTLRGPATGEPRPAATSPSGDARCARCSAELSASRARGVPSCRPVTVTLGGSSACTKLRKCSRSSEEAKSSRLTCEARGGARLR
eukprot:scaffold8530_cov60-Phaeocystis_antarctica.AAC.1